jgi:hypothetical protein
MLSSCPAKNILTSRLQMNRRGKGGPETSAQVSISSTKIEGLLRKKVIPRAPLLPRSCVWLWPGSSRTEVLRSSVKLVET